MKTAKAILKGFERTAKFSDGHQTRAITISSDEVDKLEKLIASSISEAWADGCEFALNNKEDFK